MISYFFPSFLCESC